MNETPHGMHTALRLALVLLLVNLGHVERVSAQSSLNGDRFWFGFMANYGGSGARHLRVYVASEQATTGTISMPQLGWSTTFNVPVGGSTNVLIPLSAICTASDTIQGKGILIESGHAITVQALNFEDATADATSILPETQLGTDHRIIGYESVASIGVLRSELLVVATEDSTEVEIVPACNTFGGHAAGVPFTVLLQQGETYFLKGLDAVDDLTGTRVRIPSPVGCQRLAVFGGSQCANVPVGCFACDHLYEQMTPVHDWGTRYFLTPFNASLGYTYRVLANEDSTHVSVNGSMQPLLMAGQYLEVNAATLAGCIGSDKPVGVAQYMQGSVCSGGLGDPSMLLPPSDDDPTTLVTFSTVSSSALTIHTLNVVMDTSNLGLFKLDGSVIPAQYFSPFTQCPDHVWLALPLTDGLHTASAPNGFSGVVYGTGPNNESYAYSLGSGSQPALDSVLCVNDTVITLTAPSGFGLGIWSLPDTPYDTLATGPTYTFNPTVPVTIAVRDTVPGSACDATGLYRVDPTDTLLVNASVLQGPLCPPVTAVLQAEVQPPQPGVQYQWTPQPLPGSGAPDSLVVVLAATTTYMVTATSANGCSSGSDATTVLVLPPADAPIITQHGDSLFSTPAASYAWFLNGTAIPGADQQVYVASAPGIYVVVILDANGCTATSIGHPFLLNAIDATDRTALRCWSDGAGHLQVECDRPLDRVTVWNALGQQELSITPSKTRIAVPLSGSGVHLVRAEVGGTILVRRLVLAP